MPVPTSEVAVHVHVCPDSYSNVFYACAWVQVDACARWNEISSRHFWYMVELTRMRFTFPGSFLHFLQIGCDVTWFSPKAEMTINTIILIWWLKHKQWSFYVFIYICECAIKHTEWRWKMHKFSCLTAHEQQQTSYKLISLLRNNSSKRETKPKTGSNLTHP